MQFRSHPSTKIALLALLKSATRKKRLPISDTNQHLAFQIKVTILTVHCSITTNYARRPFGALKKYAGVVEIYVQFD